MAHADYECCARCDSKMAYNSDAEAKAYVCPDCALDLLELTGQRITDGETLAAFVLASTPEAVASLGISPCYYGNPVDFAVAQVATVAELAGQETDDA